MLNDSPALHQGIGCLCLLYCFLFHFVGSCLRVERLIKVVLTTQMARNWYVIVVTIKVYQVVTDYPLVDRT